LRSASGPSTFPGTPQAAPSVWKPCSHGGGVNDASAAGTPLLWAASAGYLEGAKLLLEKGADVAGQDGDGVTALLLSAALGASPSALLGTTPTSRPCASKG